MSVFICPRSYLPSYAIDLHRIVFAFYLWPWLGFIGGVVTPYVVSVLSTTSHLLGLTLAAATAAAAAAGRNNNFSSFRNV